MDCVKMNERKCARLEQLLKTQLKCASSADPTPDSPGLPPSKETRPEKYEKKRRRTPPDLTYNSTSFSAITSNSSPMRRRSLPRVTIDDEATVMPSIVVNLVNEDEGVPGSNGEIIYLFLKLSLSEDEIFSEESPRRLSVDGLSESETEMADVDTRPIPILKESLPHAQLHDEYTTIADTIRIDRNLYNDVPHFHYEPEPMCTEEESDVLAQAKEDTVAESS
ncbi:hypothetical protein COOONC_10874 [Cooperia oncophora]